jgi:hypothetical protein
LYRFAAKAALLFMFCYPSDLANGCLSGFVHLGGFLFSCVICCVFAVTRVVIVGFLVLYIQGQVVNDSFTTCIYFPYFTICTVV